MTRIALLLALLASAAYGAECGQPKFSLSDLKVGDDGLDRGYPGGVSLVDVDGDGDVDVMATRGYDPTAKPYRGDRSTLYLNDGSAKFSRADAPFSAVDTPDSGSTWADVDGDGDPDAFVSVQHKLPDYFYRNLGGGEFAREDLGEATSTPGSNFTSSWVDIDGDADLDLYVGGPTLERAQESLVYRNDNGAFRRVTGNIIDNGLNNPGAALWADVDNDGDQDLFVANSDILRQSKLEPASVEHPVLYVNEGNWTFARSEGQSFSNITFSAVTAAFGDIDNDGDLDLYLGMYGLPGGVEKFDRIFLNDGAGHFALTDVALPSHVQLATGAAFADFNLDGNLDLISTSYNSPIHVHLGDGAGGFSLVNNPELAARVKSHWSIATADLNGDARIDAVVGDWGETRQGEFMTLALNETELCGAFVEIALVDENGAPNPPGARVTLATKGKGGEIRRQLREASAQTGFRSQSASSFLFAVPPGEKIRRAKIRWPDGSIVTVKKLKPGERRVVRKD
jgi:hypothetical protein